MVVVWHYREFWINAWSSLVLCVCLALALGSSYALLERASTVVLGLLVLCVAVSDVVFGPNVFEMLSGLFVPRVPDYPDWVLEEYPKVVRDRSPWLEVSVYLTAVGGGAYLVAQRDGEVIWFNYTPDAVRAMPLEGALNILRALVDDIDDEGPGQQPRDLVGIDRSMR